MKGFICPHCSAPCVRLRVYRVRTPCAGRVVRYRECPRCGYRECTIEKRTHTLPTRKREDESTPVLAI